MNDTPHTPEPAADSSSSAPRLSAGQPENRPWIWQGKFLPAFWTVAAVISILINIILIAVVLALASQLFRIKNLVQVQLIDGLYENFVRMDEAHIVTTIQVSDTIQVQDTIPVVFDLPLKQGTEITLTKDTPIRRALVYLNGQAVPTDITLRQGTRMSIALDMVVPVNQTIPVALTVPINLQVPVDIPLTRTELHQPFAGLQDVVAPYKKLLDGWPDSWGELLCQTFGDPLDGGLFCNP